MADNYLEKRYEETLGAGHVRVKRVGHTLDELILRNRSYRGYLKDYVVKKEELERIVGVCNKIPSARNQQVLRFRLITKGDGSEKILKNIKLGAALPELHLPVLHEVSDRDLQGCRGTARLYRLPASRQAVRC